MHLYTHIYVMKVMQLVCKKCLLKMYSHHKIVNGTLALCVSEQWVAYLLWAAKFIRLLHQTKYNLINKKLQFKNIENNAENAKHKFIYKWKYVLD